MFSFLRRKTRDLSDRAKIRWRSTEADEGLTWGAIWDASNFVEALLKRVSFTPSTSILEIGPGYGRVLDQILKEGLPFQSYLGLDLSLGRINRLTEKYQDDERIEFMHGDVETFQLDQRFDLCISSATFVHLYPNCKKALRNCEQHMKSGGYVAFDVQPRPEAWNKPSGGWHGDTYGCAYVPSDIEKLIARSRLYKLTSERILHGQSVTGEDVVCLFVAMRVK